MVMSNAEYEMSKHAVQIDICKAVPLDFTNGISINLKGIPPCSYLELFEKYRSIEKILIGDINQPYIVKYNEKYHQFITHPIICVDNYALYSCAYLNQVSFDDTIYQLKPIDIAGITIPINFGEEPFQVQLKEILEGHKKKSISSENPIFLIWEDSVQGHPAEKHLGLYNPMHINHFIETLFSIPIKNISNVEGKAVPKTQL